MKRLSADDSADSRVKVGHRQALIRRKAQLTGSAGLILLRDECIKLIVCSDFSVPGSVDVFS